jgi:choline kinase
VPVPTSTREDELMQGVVLAAGGGTRLRPLTDDCPKTLLPVAEEVSILELAVANLAAAGVVDVTVVTGHAAHRIEAIADGLARRHGVTLSLRHNPRHAELNNAYSLWLVRDLFPDGVLLVNGDTVHPPHVEERLLAADDDGAVRLALDDRKALAEEEMKVEVDDTGQVTCITKQSSPEAAAGEYIGVARIDPGAAELLAASLEAAFAADPNRYYEDGFQVLADRGGRLTVVPITPAAWVEVDDHDDLATARRVTAGW